MNRQRRINTICGMGVFAMLTLPGVAAIAQQAQLQGMIIGRDGSTMYVRTSDSARQIVELSDSTKATQKGGFMGWSHKDLGVASLVPGLDVKIDGKYDGDHKLIADKVEFSRSSMKTAKQIDAGLDPVNGKLAQQEDMLASNRKTLSDHGLTLDEHGKLIAANAQAEGEDRAAIGATNSRIGDLDQYDTKGTLTVNFKNGSAVVSKKDQDALSDFVKSAAESKGFMVQVQGYASKTGSQTLNQKLSSERADAVLTIIQQSGAVPLTRILAPAAMGTSEQVADNHSRSGQAQNRRVVVSILVNKGITGSVGQSAQATQPAPMTQADSTPTQQSANQ
jgi:OOP family OmpA-OmpF porin